MRQGKPRWKRGGVYMGVPTLVYTTGDTALGAIECHIGSCVAYAHGKRINAFLDVNEAKKAVEKAVGQ